MRRVDWGTHQRQHETDQLTVAWQRCFYVCWAAGIGTTAEVRTAASATTQAIDDILANINTSVIAADFKQRSDADDPRIEMAARSAVANARATLASAQVARAAASTSASQSVDIAAGIAASLCRLVTIAAREDVDANYAQIAASRSSPPSGVDDSAAAALASAAMFSDAHFLRSNGQGDAARQLLAQPLWLSPKVAYEEHLATEPWRFTRPSPQLSPSARFWIDWYARRLKGGPSAWGLPANEDDEISQRIASQRDDFWEPKSDQTWREKIQEIHTSILGWIEGVKSKSDPSGSKEIVFISSASENKSMAKEVEKVVRSTGRETIVQFRDFPNSNFAEEMKKGLKRSDRLVALYSPQYEASGHCQTEWNAFHNRDPRAEKRSIIAFLLEPTDLNELAKQRVYKSLIGLSREERRAAILEWIEYKPPETRTEQISELENMSSPQPLLDEHGRLDSGPNEIFDKLSYSKSLLDIPAVVRKLCGDALTMAGNEFYDIRYRVEQYLEEFETSGLHDATEELKTDATLLSKLLKRHLDLHGASGLTDTLEELLRKHYLLVQHFPLDAIREELIRAVDIEANPEQVLKLRDLVARLESEVIDLRRTDDATDRFEKTVRRQKHKLDDMQDMPSPPEEDTNVPSPEKRTFANMIGFYERLVKIANDTAKLAENENLKQAAGAVMKALREFIP